MEHAISTRLLSVTYFLPRTRPILTVWLVPNKILKYLDGRKEEAEDSGSCVKHWACFFALSFISQPVRKLPASHAEKHQNHCWAGLGPSSGFQYQWVGPTWDSHPEFSWLDRWDSAPICVSLWWFIYWTRVTEKPSIITSPLLLWVLCKCLTKRGIQ